MKLKVIRQPLIGGISILVVAAGLLVACDSTAKTPTPTPTSTSITPGYGAVSSQPTETGGGNLPNPVSATPTIAPTTVATPEANNSSTSLEPVLSLSASSVTRNTQVTASAKGFAANETVTISAASSGNDSQSITLGTGQVDGQGTLGKVTFTLPADAPLGFYTIKASGDQSGHSATTSLALVGQYPWLELGTYTGKPGSTLSLKAGGFLPGESVQIFLDRQPKVTLGTAHADQQGSLQVSDLKIPFIAEGDVPLVILGDQSQTEASRVLSIVAFHPWGLLSAYALRPSDAIDLSGFDFVPNEPVTVTLDGVAMQLSTTPKADGFGVVRLQHLFTAKPADVGKHELKLSSADGQRTVDLGFEVLPYVPRMELTTYAGRPGTKVGFTGQGFAPGEVIHAYLGEGISRQEVASFTASSNGDFSNAGLFEISSGSPEGPVLVTLEGEQSHIPVSQKFGVLALQPWAGLNAYSGTPGTLVQFSGKGFAAGETVTISLGGTTPVKVTSATADADGSFQGVGPVAIPGDASGTLTYVFHGEKSGAEATATFTVTGSR